MRTWTLTRWTRTLLVVVMGAIATIQVSPAADYDPGWTLRLDVSWVDPSGDFEATGTGGTTLGTSFDSGFGAGLRAEYQFSPRLGLEVGVLSAGSVDIDTGFGGGLNGSDLEVSSFTPLSVGLNVHLTPDHAVDLYAGPLLAWVSYSDIDVRTGFGTASTSVSVDNDLGLGAIVGLDIPLGEQGWLIQANLRYIATDINNSGGAVSINSKFDPAIFSVGFGYRF